MNTILEPYLGLLPGALFIIGGVSMVTHMTRSEEAFWTTRLAAASAVIATLLLLWAFGLWHGASFVGGMLAGYAAIRIGRWHIKNERWKAALAADPLSAFYDPPLSAPLPSSPPFGHDETVEQVWRRCQSRFRRR